MHGRRIRRSVKWLSTILAIAVILLSLSTAFYSFSRVWYFSFGYPVSEFRIECGAVWIRWEDGFFTRAFGSGAQWEVRHEHSNTKWWSRFLFQLPTASRTVVTLDGTKLRPETEIRFPLWTLLIAFAVPAFVVWRKERMRLRWSRDGRCPSCGQGRDGIRSEVACPECGHRSA